MSRKTVFECVDFLPHGPHVGHDSPGPVQNAFSLGRESAETRPALDQKHAERVLKLLDPSRERRLAHAAAFRSVSKMALLGERDEKFELVDHAVPEARTQFLFRSLFR